MSREEDPRIASLIRRAKYKQILQKGGKLAENSDGQNIAHNLLMVTSLMQESNILVQQGKMSDRIGQNSEVVLDAQVMKMNSDLIAITMRKIECFQFSDEEYARGLAKLIPNERDSSNWKQLDDMITNTMNTVWYSQSMHGTFNMTDEGEQEEATQRKRQNRPRNPLADEERPQILTQATARQKGSQKLLSIMEQIKHLYNVRNKKPLPYYEVIIDPDNMMHTFENAFAISFLFRDAKIGFTSGDDNLPAIFPMGTAKQPENAQHKQFIATFNYELFEKMKAKYGITEPLILVKRDDQNDSPE